MKKIDIEAEFDMAIQGFSLLISDLSDSPEDEVQKDIYMETATRLFVSKQDFIKMYDDAKERREKEDLDDKK